MDQVSLVPSVIYGLYWLTSLHFAICVKQMLPSSPTKLVRINVSHTNAAQRSRTLSTASQLTLLICVMSEAFARSCTTEIPFTLGILWALGTIRIRARQTQRNTHLRLLAHSLVPLSCQRTLYDRSAWFTTWRISTSGRPFGLTLTGLLFRYPPYMLWEPPHAPCTLVIPEFLRRLDSYGQLSLQLSDHLFSLPSARPANLVKGTTEIARSR